MVMAERPVDSSIRFAALPVGVEVFHVEPLHVPDLDAERCVVWMRPAPTLGSAAIT